MFFVNEGNKGVVFRLEEKRSVDGQERQEGDE